MTRHTLPSCLCPHVVCKSFKMTICLHLPVLVTLSLCHYQTHDKKKKRKPTNEGRRVGVRLICRWSSSQQGRLATLQSQSGNRKRRMPVFSGLLPPLCFSLGLVLRSMRSHCPHSGRGFSFQWTVSGDALTEVSPR